MEANIGLITKFLISIYRSNYFAVILNKIKREEIRTEYTMVYENSANEFICDNYRIRFEKRSPQSFSKWLIYFTGKLKLAGYLTDFKTYGDFLRSDLWNSSLFGINEEMNFEFEDIKIKMFFSQ